MKQESLFRKAALDRLSSPEELDQLMQVTTPRAWLALIQTPAHPMKKLRTFFILILLLVSFACRDRVDVKKVAAGEGYLLLDPEGSKIKVLVEEMEIFLIDPDYQDKYPETYVIHGPDLELVGTFPMSVHVGYGEHFDQMMNQTIDIAASGDPSRRRNIESNITIPGEPKAYVRGGTLRVTKVDQKVLQGDITLDLEGGKTVSGKFAFKTVTWG